MSIEEGPSHREVTDLFGRSRELSLISSLLQEVLRGQGRALLIEGGPGTGKSALVATAVARGRHLGLDILDARAEGGEQRISLTAVAHCLAAQAPRDSSPAAAGPRARKNSSLRIGCSDEDTLGPERVLPLLRAWCARRPVLLALDDLQWADSSMLLFLHRLRSYLPSLALMLILGHRRVPASTPIDRLRRDYVAHGAVTVELGPLAPSSVAELAAHTLKVPVRPEVLSFLAGCGGNPRATKEALAILLRDESVQGDSGLADDAAQQEHPARRTAVPPSVSGLSQPAGELLCMASVLGPRFTMSELATALGVPTSCLMNPVAEVLQHGVLVEDEDDPDYFVFGHEPIRQALYDRLASPAAWHARAGLALATRGARVERVAEQFAHARDAWSEHLTHWTLTNALPLAAREPALAVYLLQHSVRSDAAMPVARRDRLRALLATALLWCGRPQEARRQAARALVATGEAATQNELSCILVAAERSCGSIRSATERAEHLLATRALAAAEEVQVRGLLATCLCLLGDLSRATDIAEDVRRESEQLGRHHATLEALVALAASRLVRGHVSLALETSDEALQHTSALAVPTETLVVVHILRGAALAALERMAEAADAFDAALGMAERRAHALLPACHAARGFLMFTTGAWDDALRDAQTGLALNDLYGCHHVLHGLTALIVAYRGDIAVAHASVAAAEKALRTSEIGMCSALTRWAGHILAAAENHPRRALADLRQTWQEGNGYQGNAESVLRAPDAVRLSLALGEDSTAQAITARLEAADEAFTALPGHHAVVAHCRGLLHQSPYEMKAAAPYYAQSPRKLARAAFHEDWSFVLAACGYQNLARAHLDTALDGYASLGADWCTTRARERLALKGVRVSRRQPHRPTEGWSSLTSTERTVAGLVARGMSNPEVAEHLCVSRRTVQTHVSHILAKLSLRSRVEIAARAARHN